MMTRRAAPHMALFLSIIALFVLAISDASARTWVVDDDAGPWADFTSIQDAVDNSTVGDIIRVYNGTYVENVEVNTTLSLTGNGSDETVIDGAGDIGLLVRAKGTEIVGFTVTNASTGISLESGADDCTVRYNNCSEDDYGIQMWGVANCTVSDNVLRDHARNGIRLYSGDNNTLSGNNIAGCGDYGIYIMYGVDNHLTGNNVTGNYHGIYLYSSRLNNLSNNGIGSSTWYGIYVRGGEGNVVTGNVISSNYFGINLFSTGQNTMSDNNLTGNRYGIYLTACHWNEVSNNVLNSSVYYSMVLSLSDNDTVVGNEVTGGDYGIYINSGADETLRSNNISDAQRSGVNIRSGERTKVEDNTLVNSGYGIYADSADNCTISGNTLTSNDKYGLYLTGCDNLTVHHNTFTGNGNGSRPQGFDDTGNNTWDDGSEGNWWSDYNGTDADGDGIGETPYAIDGDGNATDRYPLVADTSRTWIVDDDNGTWADFDRIQDAINASADGDIILVYNGTYAETGIVVNRSLTIVGNGSSNTTIDGGGSGTVVRINASHVNITGFRVLDSGSGTGDAGIQVVDTSNITVASLSVEGCQRGISLVGANDVSVTGVRASWNVQGVYVDSCDHVALLDVTAGANTDTGVYIVDSSDVTARNGTVTENGNDGVHVESSGGTVLEGLSVNDHQGYGIGIVGSDGVAVRACSLQNDTYGIHASASIGLLVTATAVNGSANTGIALTLLSDRARAEACVLSDNGVGISFDDSVDGVIGNTSISGSDTADIGLSGLSGSSATTYNTTFDPDGISCSVTSTLTVRNYLRVRVVDQYGDPWSGADVNITDNGDPVYASKGYGGSDPRTGGNGYIDRVPVTDRIYDGSSTATENETVAYARAQGSEASATVNMSTSHVEVLVVNLSEEGIIYVDDDNAGDPDMDGSRQHPYDTIQRGIDNASVNDTIRIWNGTYWENVNVTLPLALLGNGTGTVVDAGGSGIAVTVSADGVTLDRLNLTNGSFSYGILVDGNASRNLKDIVIRNCTISSLWIGMYLRFASNVTLTSIETQDCLEGLRSANGEDLSVVDLTMTNCTYGISITSSTAVWISDAIVEGTYDAVDIVDSDNVTVENCTIRENANMGLMANGTTRLFIRDCDVRGTGYDYAIYLSSVDGEISDVSLNGSFVGCYVEWSEDIDLRNIVMSNCMIGLYAYRSGDLHIRDMDVSRAGVGMGVLSSRNCQLVGNTVTDGENGILLAGSKNITMRNNTMRNNEFNFGVGGDRLSHFCHDIGTSNTVDGLAITYVVNGTGRTYINGTHGFIGIVNTDATVDATVNRELQGIVVAFCDDVDVEGDLSGNYFGVYVVGSSGVDISDVNVSECNITSFMLNSSWINMTSFRGDDLVNGTRLIGCHNVALIGGDLDCSGGGVELFDSRDIRLGNLTISSERDMMLENATAETLNVTFDGSSVEVDENSTLIVRNHLHIHVNATDGGDLQGADAQVLDNGETIYSTAGYGGDDPQTDEEGYIRWIVVTDRVYDGSSDATENRTDVRVKHDTWSEERSDIDMSRSHTEWFDEVPPANSRPYCYINSPMDGETIGGIWRVEGNASDDDGAVMKVEVRIDSGSWMDASTDTAWEIWYYEWDTEGVDDGEHWVYARSYDGEDYSDVASVRCYVDNSNYPPNVTVDNPVEDAVLNGTVTINGSAEDPEGSMEGVEVAIVLVGEPPSNGDWHVAEDTSGDGSWISWEYEWDTLSPNRTADGDYTVWVRARDSANHTRTVTVNVTLDNRDPPVVKVQSPQRGDELSGRVTVNGTTTEDDLDQSVDTVKIAIVERGAAPTVNDWEDAEDTSGGNESYSTWGYDWDTTDVEDGNYSIHVIARDTGGNWSEEVIVNVSVDNVNVLPHTVVEGPGEGADVSVIVDVTGFVIDPDDKIDRIECSIDDETFSTNKLQVTVHHVRWNRWNWSAKWDTRAYDEGNHTIFARAVDKRGAHSNIYTVNVTVWTNVPPKLTFTSPAEGEDDVVWKVEQDYYFVQWDDDDPDDNASIKIYYDSDDQGFDGHLIAKDLWEDTLDDQGREIDVTRWDLADVPEGDYYLYAVLDDRAHDPVKVYSKGRVLVRNRTPNSPPTVDITQPDGEGDAIEPNGTYRLWFNVSDPDGDDVSVYLYYDDDTDRGNGYSTISDEPLEGANRSYLWDTTGIARGRYYVLLAAYDGVNDPVWTYSPGPLSIGDVVRPAGVHNLTAVDPGYGGTINLTWNAPGDDGDVGTVHHYVGRYSTSSITQSTWDSATPFAIDIVPGPPGTLESTEITGLEDSTTYYVAIRAVDEAGNMGPVRQRMASPGLNRDTIAILDLPDAFEGTVTWCGYSALTARAVEGSYALPPDLMDIGVFVEVTATGDYYHDVYINITYPDADALGTVDPAGIALHRRTPTGQWPRVTDSGHDPAARLIWGHPQHLSLFAPLGPPMGSGELGPVRFDPADPEEDEEVMITVVWTDPAGRIPTEVFVDIGGLRYDLEAINGTPATGLTLGTRLRLKEGTYDVQVVLRIGDDMEVRSPGTPLTVSGGGGGGGFDGAFIGGAVAMIIIVLVLLLVVGPRLSRARKGTAGDGKAAVAAPPPPSPDVIEAEVYEPVEAIVEEDEEVIEASEITPPGATVAAQPSAAVKASTAVPGRATEPAPTPPPPAVKPTKVAPPVTAAPAKPAPAVTATPPPRLALPRVPATPKPAAETPRAIETEVIDVGRIMLAPCPTCGHKVVIPKERPVDITCDGCGDEFTVR